MGFRVRFPILLIVLGLVVWQLVERKAGASGDSAKTCVLDRGPTLPLVSPAAVADLAHATGIYRLGWNGAVETTGAQNPESAWSDGSPIFFETARPESRFPAGWEIRWWSPEREHFVAAVFSFASGADAQRWVNLGSSAHCRGHASTHAGHLPAGARDLTWRNPLGLLQADVFFARGKHAYRVAVVPPGADASDVPGADRLLPETEAMACRLPEAGC